MRIRACCRVSRVMPSVAICPFVCSVLRMLVRNRYDRALASVRQFPPIYSLRWRAACVNLPVRIRGIVKLTLLSSPVSQSGTSDSAGPPIYEKRRAGAACQPLVPPHILRAAQQIFRAYPTTCPSTRPNQECMLHLRRRCTPQVLLNANAT